MIAEGYVFKGYTISDYLGSSESVTLIPAREFNKNFKKPKDEQITF